MIERLLQPLLARAARGIVVRHAPLVIGISGSVGKTSAKDAISCVLRERAPTTASPENQNDELGVPLSIIGSGPSGRNVLGWLATLGRAQRLLVSRRGSYATCLVLELGSCHKGDVEYLVRLSSPHLGVLTAIEPTHLEYYGSLDAIELEEGKVVTMLPPTGVGVVNIDDRRVAAVSKRATCRLVGYGFGSADVRGLATKLSVDWSRIAAATTLDVVSGDERGRVTLDGVLGRHSCYAPLAALAVARAVGISFAEALNALAEYHPPEGRMQCRRGVDGSLLVDDTYNSSPAAARRALEALAAAANGAPGEAIAVLGPMSELGATSATQHRAVGRHAARVGVDRIITVGEPAAETARGAREAGLLAARVIACGEVDEAVTAALEHAGPGAVVLVKGSRSSQMDRVATALRERTQSPAGAAAAAL